MPEPVMVGGRPRTWTNFSLVLVAVLVLLLTWSVTTRLIDRNNETGQEATPETGPSAQDVAARFLAAWQSHDWDGLQTLITDPSLDVASEHRRAHEALDVEGTFIEARPAVEEPDRLRVPFTVTWRLRGLGDVSYDSELPVVQTDDGWRVRWWYPVLHPKHAPGRRFQRITLWPDRAPILDHTGRPIVSHAGRVVVGVQPARMRNGPESVLGALAAHTDADIDAARRTLEREDLDPASFHALVTLDDAEFAAARDSLVAVPGIITRRSSARTPDAGALGPLIGRLGEVTSEQLEQFGDPYVPGDTVGRSGLERAFERQLAGQPVEDAAIVEGSSHVTTLAYREGTPPAPLETTLDPRIQQAAAAALQGVGRAAAIVAVDAPTGEVRAASWTGDLPIALEGRYPPGSTFKIVDAAAMFAAGARPDTVVDCPPEIRLGGRMFRNAGSYGPGPINVLEAFARSCNTAFAIQASQLGAPALADTAAKFGFGTTYDAGLTVFGASFPAPVDTAELAAAAIGQGRVEASPLHMASVAAAARSGVWRAPHLIRGLDVPHQALPGGTAGMLGTLMREVVTNGTGTAAALPGDSPVAGKTGSAQFGDGSSTHAWFVGYRGDLAFAVLVESGGGGGAVAGPVAQRFLQALQ